MSMAPTLSQALVDVLYYMFGPLFSWIGAASTGTVILALIIVISVLIITGKIFRRLDVCFVFALTFWAYFSIIGFVARWWAVVITILLCILAGFGAWKFILSGIGGE